MATFTENLVVEISANTQDLSRGLNQAASDVNGFSGSVDESAESIRDVIQANTEFSTALAREGVDVRSVSSEVLRLNPQLASMAGETAEVASEALQGADSIAEFGKELVLGATQSRGFRGAISRLTRSFAGSLGLGAAIGALISLAPAIIGFFRDVREEADDLAEAARDAAGAIISIATPSVAGVTFESANALTSALSDAEAELTSIQNLQSDISRQIRTTSGTTAGQWLAGLESIEEKAQNILGFAGTTVETFDDLNVLSSRLTGEEAKREGFLQEGRAKNQQRFDQLEQQNLALRLGGRILEEQEKAASNIADDTERTVRAQRESLQTVPQISGRIGARPVGPRPILGLDDLGDFPVIPREQLEVSQEFLEQVALIRDGFGHVQGLAAGIGDAIGGWVTGAENFGEALAQAFLNFVAGLVSAIAQALILGAIINAIPGLREFLQLTGLVTGGGLSGGGAPASAGGSTSFPAGGVENFLRAGVRSGNLTISIPANQVAIAAQTGQRVNIRSGAYGT